LKVNSWLFVALAMVFFLLVLTTCAGKPYRKMAIENPHALISKEDSLMRDGASAHLISSFAIAHKALGLKTMQEKDYRSALKHFSRSIEVFKKDTLLMYNLLLCKAHLDYNTGKKDKLWDAIEIYNKASLLMPSRGEAHYYIGRSYHRLGDKDFDLIIDSYQKALSLNNTKELTVEIQDNLDRAISREKRLRDFWK
tara:strand:+ start:413 stop:1000 length:588 start_codon:yes stop_codon:yes gene_type:complete